MKSLFLRLLKDEQGQDLVEYALIVAAVGLALITTVNQLSQGIVSLYSSITQERAVSDAFGREMCDPLVAYPWGLFPAGRRL
jgi:Flp pilus assembly pilin Flp